MRRWVSGLIIISLCCLFSTIALANDKKRYITIREHTLNLDGDISTTTLERLNKSDLRLLINGIYAKYGYDFKSKKYSDYFSQYSWYQPQHANVGDRITATDWRKIDQYVNYEKSFTTESIFFELDYAFEEHNLKIQLIQSPGMKETYPDMVKYDNIRIYDLKDKQLFFELKQQDQVIQGIPIYSETYVLIEDFSDNGISEIYFSSKGLPSNLEEMLILTFVNQEIKIVFYGPLYDPKYMDVDGDGLNEMYGTISSGGQVSYNEGFRAVHALIDDHYIPSRELTWQFELGILKELEAALVKDSTLKNLDQFIRQFAYMGLYNEAQLVLKQYPELMKEYQAHIGNNPTTNEGFYIQRLKPMSEHYQFMWQVTNWQDTDQKKEVPR